MTLTVYRRPLLYLGAIIGEGKRARKRAPPARTLRPLETFEYEAALEPKRRVAIRFPFGDWIPFHDDGEPCWESMRDYVLSPESVAKVKEARLVEAREAKEWRKAQSS